jgi:predicted XRE-type DNA-binding protein
MKLKMTRSSGNVFRDIGFPPGEAEHLLVRSDLMIKVQKLIESKHLTQAELAKVLHITQPRISDLRRGRIDRAADPLRRHPAHYRWRRVEAARKGTDPARQRTQRLYQRHLRRP